MRCGGRRLGLLIGGILLFLALAGPVEAHHRTQYYWFVGGANPLGPGGDKVEPPGSDYRVGGLSFECPLKDCTFHVRNEAANFAWVKYCYRDGGSLPDDCSSTFDSKRVKGYRYITVFPSDKTGSGTIDVYARQVAAYGFGLERSQFRLPYPDAIPRSGMGTWEFWGYPPPSCARHFLDVNQDGNVVQSFWLEQAGPAILPDLYFYDAFGTRIGAQLAPFYGETPLPTSTASILVCNKATVHLRHGVSTSNLLPDPGPLLLLQISRPSGVPGS